MATTLLINLLEAGLTNVSVLPFSPDAAMVWNGTALEPIPGAPAFIPMTNTVGHSYTAALPAALEGTELVCVVYSSDVSPTVTDPLLGEITLTYNYGADIYASATALSASIRAGHITVVSPVSDTGLLTIARGDTYSLETNKAIVFEDTGNTIPVLTGATVVLTVRLAKDDRLQLTKIGTVTTPRSVRFELTARDTANLVCGSLNSRYDVSCTLPDGSVSTIFMGDATIVRDVTY